MKLEGCTDGGCIFGHPGGMHTNGGCACVSTLMVLPHDDRRRFQRNIKALRDRVADLEDLLSRSRAAHVVDMEHVYETVTKPRQEALEARVAEVERLPYCGLCGHSRHEGPCRRPADVTESVEFAKVVLQRMGKSDG